MKTADIRISETQRTKEKEARKSCCEFINIFLALIYTHGEVFLLPTAFKNKS